uniref:Uncharacterized protein n=1 Tax=Oryza glumipatula TaxID=40148 RepID=A0A0D9ZTP9_9ORYZ
MWGLHKSYPPPLFLFASVGRELAAVAGASSNSIHSLLPPFPTASLLAAVVRQPASGGDPGVALERRQRRVREGQSGGGGGGGDRGRRGRLAIGRKKTGHENGRVLATLGPATALSTAALDALSTGHDALASAVLPPCPRTRKGRLRLATATHVGILSKMAASGGSFFCTCGGGVEGGRSNVGEGGGGTTDGRGQHAEPADNGTTT